MLIHASSTGTYVLLVLGAWGQKKKPRKHEFIMVSDQLPLSQQRIGRGKGTGHMQAVNLKDAFV